MTDIFITDLNEYNIPNQNLTNSISKEFYNSIYKRPIDILSSSLGRGLLSYGLKKIYKIDVDLKSLVFNKYGRPRLPGLSDTLDFNISHSGQFVVCAISDSIPVGIDIEKIKKIEIDSFKSYMTAQEYRNIIYSEKSQEEFFGYWTKKEAVLKAIGRGLSMNLNGFEIMGNETSVEGEKYYFKEIPIHQCYKSHLAIKKNINVRKINTVRIKIEELMRQFLPLEKR
ncbi:4'-phosphopantetheinyl transferase superfamily protein [Muricauda sp. SCSIO 64092]|uniref:4'-phosphopantetheinyl transferase family protein n=1 Tax=Allomuricauda sp. SCSIO 64092 TaxID=2908842 RepID=UPI001FF2FC22|nr:4'-phosphopantetheinyl transferase superfamily protein [Muricauda sp. SCSIO 64092]UOY05738.1 4'-phosphopantetheinyl transferase superfamily protein [Muricauda sp. SCSIO 64092]